MEGDNLLPSRNNRTYWIGARNLSQENNNSLVKRHTGKWLLFHTLDEIDEAWSKIKAATEAGKLGHYSCVSTIKHDIEPKVHVKQTHKVICVMTYSEYDEDDIFHVRDILRTMEYEEILGYKTWKATRSRKYANQGHRGICKFRA